MRGAGAADHTADSKRASKAALAEAEREAQVQIMTTCAITGAALDFKDNNIVACPLGRLYGREAAIQALLRRKEIGIAKDDNYYTPNESESADLGWQVRNMKDLHPVRFQLIKKVSNGDDSRVPICPITSVDLNGVQPAFLIVKMKQKKAKANKERDDDNANVLSEKGMKEMGSENLQDEYGPFKKEDLIRLAPPPSMLNDIKSKLREKYQVEKSAKLAKKKRKKNGNTDTGTCSDDNRAVKRIHVDISSKSTHSGNESSKRIRVNVPKDDHSSKKPKTISDIRNNIAAVASSNSVLSGLFSDKQSHLTEKEKKNKLFTSNC